MGLLQRIVLVVQLVAALGAELAKLSSPGATATVPPAGVDAPTVKVEGAEFEVRLTVRRTR